MWIEQVCVCSCVTFVVFHKVSVSASIYSNMVMSSQLLPLIISSLILWNYDNTEAPDGLSFDRWLSNYTSCGLETCLRTIIRSYATVASAHAQGW